MKRFILPNHQNKSEYVFLGGKGGFIVERVTHHVAHTHFSG